MVSTPSHWQSRGILAILLLPVAALFLVIAMLRRGAWRSGLRNPEKAGVPIIVVGNITAGGTGKTPLTLWLAYFLRERGKHPAIISRGYGADRTDPRPVPVDGNSADYGDEPCLLAQRVSCPVWVGVDRAATAMALSAAHPDVDVIISDDGLQHYRLARDFEIAVIDGVRGLGNGWPLPAGPLREPRSRLASMDAVVVNAPDETKVWPNAITMQLKGNVLRNLYNPLQTAEARRFSGRRVHAVAGIGNPQRFFRYLETLGITCEAHAFPDHHRYSANDLQFGDSDDIVMTEKDAVKCTAFATSSHWALVIDAEIDASFGEMILERLSKADRHG